MANKILFVLTSHAQKGDTGKPTGFYLSEVTHPHSALTKAGYIIEFVSPQGGEPPIDGYDLKDPINKAFMENKFLLESKLKEHRAHHTKAENFQKQVVISDRLITGQNPASATGVGEAMAKVLAQKP